MGAWSPAGTIMLLIFWAIAAGVTVILIRYAVNTSKIVEELREIRKELQLLRKEQGHPPE